ncbi:MAG: FadR/GntR family transcriptional regulator [Bilophila wadsworthia]
MDKQECIERQLESALLEGRWGVFERLPSERGLAEAFGVNRATVRAALRALAGRGILETRRGSGTVVRALPGDARHAAGTFADYLAAFRILMPPLVAASLPAVSPSVILELERLLPSAGASLRNGDMKTFIQAQIRFFSILIRVLGNPRLEDAASRVLPDGLALARLLQECTLPQCENVFAQLARLLTPCATPTPGPPAKAVEGNHHPAGLAGGAMSRMSRRAFLGFRFSEDSGTRDVPGGFPNAPARNSARRCCGPRPSGSGWTDRIGAGELASAVMRAMYARAPEGAGRTG